MRKHNSLSFLQFIKSLLKSCTARTRQRECLKESNPLGYTTMRPLAGL